MTTELQARLRDKAEQAAAIGGCPREDMLYWQAAAEIARLTSEVERLGKLLTDTGDERDTLQWKADALAKAVLALHDDFLTDIGCDPDMTNARIANTLKLLAALTDYQEGK